MTWAGPWWVKGPCSALEPVVGKGQTLHAELMWEFYWDKGCKTPYSKHSWPSTYSFHFLAYAFYHTPYYIYTNIKGYNLFIRKNMKFLSLWVRTNFNTILSVFIYFHANFNFSSYCFILKRFTRMWRDTFVEMGKLLEIFHSS